jgi:Reverse transcriptase (RNA-dependent DNA polymerase)
LRYVRYADDILFGFTGPKAEAEEIKRRLAQFLQEDLKLELSEQKTLITHARTDAARFLGYEIAVGHNNQMITSGRRAANGAIRLRVPTDVIKAKRARYMQRDKPERRPELMNEEDHDHQPLWGRVLGHRPVLPAGRRRLATDPAAVGDGDVAA